MSAVEDNADRSEKSIGILLMLFSFVPNVALNRRREGSWSGAVPWPWTGPAQVGGVLDQSTTSGPSPVIVGLEIAVNSTFGELNPSPVRVQLGPVPIPRLAGLDVAMDQGFGARLARSISAKPAATGLEIAVNESF